MLLKTGELWDGLEAPSRNEEADEAGRTSQVENLITDVYVEVTLVLRHSSSGTNGWKLVLSSQLPPLISALEFPP